MSSSLIYCVYITLYRGNRLPPFYIGSSSVERIHSGYRGSVRSKEYKQIWNEEIKNSSYLFETKIISLHSTRREATEKELKIHLLLDVVNNKLYSNKSTAMINGFFGMDVSGKNNPNFGKKHNVTEKCRQHRRENGKETIWLSHDMLDKTIHVKLEKYPLYYDQGWYLGRKIKTSKKSLLSMQKRSIDNNQISYTCPHCSKVGKGPGMKRYHFNNCRKQEVHTSFIVSEEMFKRTNLRSYL